MKNMDDALTIRNSRPADAAALRQLAALDSQTLPNGDLIVAEVCGTVVAAYSPAKARTIADPFRRTADVVELLRLRAQGSRPSAQRTRTGLLPRLA